MLSGIRQWSGICTFAPALFCSRDYIILDEVPSKIRQFAEQSVFLCNYQHKRFEAVVDGGITAAFCVGIIATLVGFLVELELDLDEFLLVIRGVCCKRLEFSNTLRFGLHIIYSWVSVLEGVML